MKSTLHWLINLALFLGGPPAAYAQTYAPTVRMTITAPSGEAHEVSARDSEVATLTLKDGSVFEVRPVVHDEPFTRVTVSIFKPASASAATSLLGEVDVVKGAPAIAMKTTPSFKVAVRSVALENSKT